MVSCTNWAEPTFVLVVRLPFEPFFLEVIDVPPIPVINPQRLLIVDKAFLILSLALASVVLKLLPEPVTPNGVE